MGCSGNQEYYCPGDAQPARQVIVGSFSIGQLNAITGKK